MKCYSKNYLVNIKNVGGFNRIIMKYKLYRWWNGGVLRWKNKNTYDSIDEMLEFLTKPSRFLPKDWLEKETFIVCLKTESYRDEMIGIIKNGVYIKL